MFTMEVIATIYTISLSLSRGLVKYTCEFIATRAHVYFLYVSDRVGCICFHIFITLKHLIDVCIGKPHGDEAMRPDS